MSLPAREKSRLLEKFAFLESGMWDTGVRVKKLKGVGGKTVFEARINRGDRLIFTLGREGANTCIYLWGAVRHDDISSAARTVLPENAPFLTFDPVDEQDFTDLLIDDLPDDCYSQEALEEQVNEDYGPQKWLDIRGEREWQRLLARRHPEYFEILLYLTGEQRRVLERDPPVLISGTAGSGKTTIAVYSLLRHADRGKSLLFLTCSRYLRDFSQRLYRGLVTDPAVLQTAQGVDFGGSLEPVQISGPAGAALAGAGGTKTRGRRKLSGESGPDTLSGQPVQLLSSGGTVRFAVFDELVREIISSSAHHKGDSPYADDKKQVGLKEFRAIFDKHSLARRYDPELVWEEIRSIIKGAHPPINVKRYRDLINGYLRRELGAVQTKDLCDALIELKNFDFADKFERICRRKSGHTDFDAFVRDLLNPVGLQDSFNPQMLIEILQIVESKQSRFRTPLLSLQEYLALGKKRAPNFLYDREDIYTIARYYQTQLDAEGRWDEIDLCREAIRALDRSRDRYIWDIVVCDEVQDFSDIQLALVFRLSRTPGMLICAGDPKQIINPSGFRWEEVKYRFYERGIAVPDVYSLNLNFRCVGSIVKLSNALLDLKQRLVGLAGHEQREVWKFSGRPPFLLRGVAEKEVLESLGTMPAGSIVLVRSEAEQHRIKKILGTELVFTIQEAKGLEFDTVLIWRFSSDRKTIPLWRRIAAGQYLEPAHHPHIRHEINLLYVAVTRGRNTLIVYEGEDAAPVWELDELEPLVVPTRSRDDLTQIWSRLSTPQEWEVQGRYFFEREYYHAALECFRNAGIEEMVDVSQAQVLAGEGNWAGAAALFFRRRRHREAADAFERAEDYQQALNLWKKLKERDRARMCSIRIMESAGDYRGAAREWIKLGRTDLALAGWQRVGAWSQIAAFYRESGKFDKASEYYERAGQIADAAFCLKRLKKTRAAADLYFSAKAYPEAEKLYRSLKEREKVIECLRRSGDFYREGIELERARRPDDAARAFNRYAETGEEARRKLIAEAEACTSPQSQGKAAVRYAAAGEKLNAAECFFRSRNYQQAIDAYLEVKEYARAANCAVIIGDIESAVRYFESAGAPEYDRRAAREITSYVYRQFRIDETTARKFYLEARELKERGRWSQALTRFLGLRQIEDIIAVGKRVEGRDEEILDCFFDMLRYDKTIEFVEQRRRLTVSPEWLDSLMTRLHPEAYIQASIKGSFTEARAVVTAAVLESGEPSDSRLIRTAETHALKILDDIPAAIVEIHRGNLYGRLACRTRQYNVMFDMLLHSIHKNSPEYRELAADISATDQSAAENRLLAMLASTVLTTGRSRKLTGKKRAEAEELLKSIVPDVRNWKLFTVTETQTLKAVEFLKSRKMYDHAERVLSQSGRYVDAALMHEKLGNYKQASRIYRDNHDYEEALRCSRTGGDEISIARILERMERFHEALAIWKRLKRRTDVERLKRKMAKFGIVPQENDSAGGLSRGSVGQAGAVAGPGTGSAAGPKPGLKTGVKPAAKAGPKPGPKTGVKPAAKAGPKPGPKTGAKPAAKAGPKPDVKFSSRKAALEFKKNLKAIAAKAEAANAGSTKAGTGITRIRKANQTDTGKEKSSVEEAAAESRSLQLELFDDLPE